MSFWKYIEKGESQPRTPDGVVIRVASGHLPFFRQEELDEFLPSYDAHVRIFDLSKPEDLKDYTEVLDRIANGDCVRLAPDLEMPDPETKSWRILCRWADVKVDIPGNQVVSQVDDTALKMEAAGLSARVEDPSSPGQQIPVSRILQIFRSYGFM